MLDGTTRKKIEAKFEAGELPATAPAAVWGGRSSGRRCAGCDALIDLDQIEVETVGADRVSRFYHPACLTYASEVRGRIQARRVSIK